MFRRLRKTLVESYVGAIALGWMFAQGILHFASVFSAPITAWLTRREYRLVVPNGMNLPGPSYKDGIPDLVRAFVVLVIGYLLLRWLYFKPLQESKDEPVSSVG